MTSIGAMADSIVEPALNVNAKTLIIFGHCSGAIVAYELAHRLAFAGQQTHGLKLVVSAQPPPICNVSISRRSPASMPLSEIKNYLREIGGTPEVILRNDEFMELIAPAIRAELTALEEYYNPAGRTRLDIPIIAIGGNNDPLISSAELRGWGNFTSGSFNVQTFDLGHFYISERDGEVIDFLRNLFTSSLS